jgi:hypothetical protein
VVRYRVLVFCYIGKQKVGGWRRSLPRFVGTPSICWIVAANRENADRQQRYDSARDKATDNRDRCNNHRPSVTATRMPNTG